jgi:cytochrome c-type biogenesis protein CcmE
VLERIGARRVLIIAALGAAVLIGAFAATNLAPNAVYYLTPTEAMGRVIGPGQVVRLGGQVKAGSLLIEFGSLTVGGFRFVITDGVNEVKVVSGGTVGAVPGLLREGAGAVVEGSFAADGSFVATQVIAKHDEVYTAPTAGATPSHRTGP